MTKLIVTLKPDERDEGGMEAKAVLDVAIAQGGLFEVYHDEIDGGWVLETGNATIKAESVVTE